MFNVLRNLKWFMPALCVGLLSIPQRGMAEDIDIFVGSSGGSAAAPNVMFLIDNSPNWSRESQRWPDGTSQGQSELLAISSVLNSITSSQPINVGLSMLTSYAGSGGTPGSGGGYIRFGARNMSVAANKTALQNILTDISNNINSPSEKLQGMPTKDEAAALYELYKYYSGLAPYTGPYSQNANADVSGNTGVDTAAGQGLTSGFAIGSNGLYQTPITSTTPCAKSYIIYIANNANNTGSSGQEAYQSSVADAGAALSPTSGLDTWTDEWTRFLYSTGVAVPSGNTNGSVVTYILDAYNAQQNVGYSNSLKNAALMGGGKYFQVSNQAAINAALQQIFAEIQAVNSTFASASLPVNTTNRSQSKNQVFIPMFRPDPDAKPRWMGNMKQYQLINSGSAVVLGDSATTPIVALNSLTGFLTDCATSFWTSDSGTYWRDVPENPSPAGKCPTTSYDKFSDAPDGPIVEKGGVAEVIRKGNNPPTTNTTPTNAVNRTIYTLSSGALAAFTTTTSGLSSSLVNFTQGQDVNAEVVTRTAPSSLTRPSLHGDSIHSRPLPVDYGGSTGVTVYYGSNDGTLRAVDSTNGKERWAFIAPESFSKLQRLMDNSPQVNYPNLPSGITPTPQPKDYFFDGSIGLYQNSDNSKVWIYPTMRRGGRMIYAFDVTTPGSPSYKWKAGCPNQTNDTDCTSGLSGIGQTWSMPNIAASVQGYSTGPVVIVGGGYDACEDANSSSPSCSTPKGAGVYVFDANDGTLIKSFSTTRSVASDVALIAVSPPGVVDHAYVADTGGNLYRIDFTSSTSTWAINRVAYTNSSGRKFLFAPALLSAGGGKVYVALGSGDREHPLQSQYPYTVPVTNRFYVYKDDLASTSANNLDDTAIMNDFTTGTTCSTAGVLPSSSAKGWFMNLNQNGTGEQTVTSGLIASGMVAFSTNRPVPQSSGTCSTSLGEARGYWVNLFNGSGGIGVTGACGGTRSAVFTGGGLPPSPVFSIVPVGGAATLVVIGAAQRTGGASSSIGAQKLNLPITGKRKTIYWKSSGEN